jgi:hypothetical protein
MATPISLADLARDPLEVARGLRAWQRGDHDEAVLQTLDASAGSLHGRRYAVWIWTGRSPAGEPLWLLPVTPEQALAFAPAPVARVLAECVRIAVAELDVDPHDLRLEAWRGRVALVLPGLLEELAVIGLAEVAHGSGTVAVAELPPDVAVEGEVLSPAPGDAIGRSGIARIAREVSRHPVDVVAALADQHQTVDLDAYTQDLVTTLRAQGLGEAPPPEPELPPSLAIEDDPCPRRRHARTVLQRMLRMGKVGPGYHTEFDHFARGAAAHDRRQALDVGEALIRAGLMIEKPSVGQRHISLNRAALPQIHALIDRGETSDPQLAAYWTAPAPTARRGR